MRTRRCSPPRHAGSPAPMQTFLWVAQRACMSLTICHLLSYATILRIGPEFESHLCSLMFMIARKKLNIAKNPPLFNSVLSLIGADGIHSLPPADSLPTGLDAGSLGSAQAANLRCLKFLILRGERTVRVASLLVTHWCFRTGVCESITPKEAQAACSSVTTAITARMRRGGESWPRRKSASLWFDEDSDWKDLLPEWYVVWLTLSAESCSHLRSMQLLMETPFSQRSRLVVS